MMIHIKGPWFKDEFERTVILRGINLSGSSKVPTLPDGATYRREGFFDHRTVSFVGRPFPLAEADEHLARLRAWGYTFLRFLVTWEAIEHAGPGQYDEAYLDYVRAVVKKAAEYDITLFIDPHQDVWSRFSGGDGAPGWTFEAVGMDMTKFHETGAAIVHALHGDPFPRMIWPTNYGKLAAATMFTLFFAGNDFAPQLKVEGAPIQEYLQSHYINAIKQVALRLRDLPNVIGYDSLNEPSAGYIGCADLNARVGMLARGDAPTALQGMALGAGHAQEVEVWDLQITGMRMSSKRTLNTQGASVWREGCLWRQHGVWDVDASGRPVILRPDYFTRVNNRDVDFYRDYFRPFANRYAREIRSIVPQTLIFVEGIPEHNASPWSAEDAPDIVHAAHWYDVVTLLTKDFQPWLTLDFRTFKPVVGRKAVRHLFAAQMADIKRHSAAEMGDVPTLIGEFGIPFDMRNQEAYRTGDFSRQVLALDTSYRAIEANLLNSTLWNYTPDNTNERGDLWNDEDLSLFSRDQQKGAAPGDLNAGGRALKAAVRPYARAIAGEPLRMSFAPETRVFEFVFRHDIAAQAPTEFYIPTLHYPAGYTVEVSDGEYEMHADRQLLIYRHDPVYPEHRVRVWDARDPAPEQVVAQKRQRQITALAIAGGLLTAGVVLWRWLSRPTEKVIIQKEE